MLTLLERSSVKLKLLKTVSITAFAVAGTTEVGNTDASAVAGAVVGGSGAAGAVGSPLVLFAKTAVASLEFICPLPSMSRRKFDGSVAWVLELNVLKTSSELTCPLPSSSPGKTLKKKSNCSPASLTKPFPLMSVTELSKIEITKLSRSMPPVTDTEATLVCELYEIDPSE